MRFLAALLVPVAVVACSSEDGKSCTEVGCQQGVQIAFSETQAGAYAIEVVVDGTTVTCAATLPLPTNDSGGACSSNDVILTRSGSALPSAQQSIGGVMLTRTDAKNVTVRITRDGTSVRNATFAPSYVVSPGPNGPDCEPKQCSLASFALP